MFINPLSKYGELQTEGKYKILSGFFLLKMLQLRATIIILHITL